MPIRIIINADDLGLSPIVNEEIDKALECGYITSTTILANTEYMEDVKQIIKKHPNASFGIHLNLTQGKAITDSIILREAGIVDYNNCFTGDVRHMTSLSKATLNAILEEWTAQLTRLCDNGIKPSHIDGHHHIHSKFELQSILLKVSRKFGIKRVRNRYSKPLKWKFEKKVYAQVSTTTPVNDGEKRQVNPTTKSKKTNLLEYLINSIMWSTRLKISGYKTTAYFDSYASCIKSISVGKTYPKNCTIELMCHPGHIDYTEEYKSICNRSIEKFIHNIKYISYNEL